MNGIQTHLPVEVLDQIIQYIIPDADYLAYPSSHPTIETLISLLTVSKATSQIAKLLLYTHCLYIDTPWRLASLLTNSLSTTNCSVPAGRIDRLYISPFSGRTINERKVVEQITELFTILAPSLKRLIINMPLRSHYPQEDVVTKLRPILRQGFSLLTNLEEFSSVQDNLFLAYWDPAIDHVFPDEEWEGQLRHWITDFMFTRYKKLKRLALSHCDMGPAFLNALSELPYLEKVVVTRPWPGLYSERFWPKRAGRLFGGRVSFTVVQATDTPSEASVRKIIGGVEDLGVGERLDAWNYRLLVSKEEDGVSAMRKWSLERILKGEMWCLTDLAGPDHLDTSPKSL
jgi:hypothetical protein